MGITTVSRTEYPRPQLVRDSWMCLNGEWDFEFDLGRSKKDQRFYENGNFTKKINVPFCPESELSGIGYKDFMAAVWYKKSVSLTADQLTGKTLLNFGAVDFCSEVWINGTAVGTHKGGYSSFTFDITSALKIGENIIVVYAEDEMRLGIQALGKQCDRFYSGGCSYTRTTGIWQTVWLEFVPNEYISKIKMVGDPKNSRLNIEARFKGNASQMKILVNAYYNGKNVGMQESAIVGDFAMTSVELSEVHLWDVGKPELYDLTVELICNGKSLDKVDSYFGLRTVELIGAAIHLNGKPVFQRLVLDQGFYPDGIYTAPTDEALKHDIEISMDLGFNGARMHEKVFEERFIYHADKLGYLVWGEYANWGLDITNSKGLEIFLPEWLEIVERDFNHASIVGWCPFNETWDRDGTRQDNEVLRNAYLVTKAIDPTRPVIDTSGNFHVITDIYDIHDYEQNVDKFTASYEAMSDGKGVHDYFKDRQTYKGQPYFVSEYGGAWWNKAEAEANTSEGGWGYGDRPKSEDEVADRYVGLTTALLKSPAVCALCYTQLYDVEQEKNGLFYYSREKKFSDGIYDRIRAANNQVAAIERVAP